MKDALRRLKADCLKILLKPVCRYCLRNSMTLQDIVEMAKVTLMDTAQDEMRLRGEAPNFSRISVMTGVHRKEVRRIHEQGEMIEKPSSHLRQVLGQWEHDKRFTTKNGRPKVLTIEGDNSEFKRLVRHVTVDVNPAAILFELERVGAVERTQKGLAMVKGHYVEREKIEEGTKLLARDTSDLVLAVEENLKCEGKPINLHGRTEYDNVYQTDVPKIRSWLIEEGTKFHKKARDYIAQFDKDVNPRHTKDGGVKVLLGTYSRIVE